MPTLHLQVCAGFANRIRALVAGLCAAEDLKIPLVIHWPVSLDCACKFSTVIDGESLPKTVKVLPYVVDSPIEVVSAEDWKKVLSEWDTTSDLRIKSYGIFHGTETFEEHLRRLRPSPFVNEFLRRRCGFIDWSSAMGVHIRRTDNLKSILGSPFESFLEAMRKQAPATFVIATDDADVRASLIQEFGPRCVFPAYVLSRTTEEGMLHAATDFFALSKCPKILGSVGSSFSEIAARYGGSTLELVS